MLQKISSTLSFIALIFLIPMLLGSSVMPAYSIDDRANLFTESEVKEVEKAFSDAAEKGLILHLVVVSELDGKAISEKSLEEIEILAERSSYSQKNVLIFISREEREVLLQPGNAIYSLTADRMNTLQETILVPSFQNNKFSEGIVQATKLMVSYLEDTPEKPRVSAENESNVVQALFVFALIVMVLIILVFIVANTVPQALKRQKAKRREQGREAAVKISQNSELQEAYSEAKDEQARRKVLMDSLKYEKMSAKLYSYVEAETLRRVTVFIDYAGIPPKYYHSILTHKESIKEYQERIYGEKKDAIIRWNESTKEAERLDNVRKEARKAWRRLTSAQRAAYALSDDRETLGEDLLPNYDDANARAKYESLADEYQLLTLAREKSQTSES